MFSGEYANTQPIIYKEYVHTNKQTNNQSIYLFYFFRGRLKSVKYANTQPMCVDHLQRDEAHKLKPYILGQYQCHTFVGNSQYFTFSKGLAHHMFSRFQNLRIYNFFFTNVFFVLFFYKVICSCLLRSKLPL